jgi:hypothetical protein
MESSQQTNDRAAPLNQHAKMKDGSEGGVGVEWRRANRDISHLLFRSSSGQVLGKKGDF